MSTDFQHSETKQNLMRAFAGESQARNRYTFAARKAYKSGLIVVERVFQFTAEQERQHASVFYNYLKDFAGESITVDGTYPVDISNNVAQLLRYAQHNELEEYDDAYKHFAQTARQEGFDQIASSFQMIAGIEKTHADRFGYYAKLLEEDKLFVSDISIQWMCLACGFLYTGTEVPEKCPVCSHDRGFFVRLSLAPYTNSNGN